MPELLLQQSQTVLGRDGIDTLMGTTTPQSMGLYSCRDSNIVWRQDSPGPSRSCSRSRPHEAPHDGSRLSPA